ncbi:hypothetical protein [Deferrisoma palaeochoriense]
MKIGFSSQRLRYEWMTRVADLCLAGVDEKKLAEEAGGFLSEALAGEGTSGRGSRQKMWSILQSIWVRPRKDLRALRDDGLLLLRELPAEQHLPVHWGMTMAAYPFWRLVSSEVGRLLRLQETVSPRQIRRRLAERVGDRELVARASRTVLRSIADWGCIEERKGGTSTVYAKGAVRPVTDPRTVAFVVESFLRSDGETPKSLGVVYRAPCFFPFSVKNLPGDQLCSVNARLQTFRSGFEDELIFIA